jgi:four helix bundle protein
LLTVTIYRITGTGPLALDRTLKEQMRRAAVSVASNIAEGNERGRDPDSCRLLYFAKGSAGELLTQLEIASELGLLPAEQGAALIGECGEIGRILRRLIDYRMNRARRSSRP